MAATESRVLGTFLGDDSFPVAWAEGQAELFWVLDDLHCPNPLSPLYFDLGGWWLTCDHMFRRFGTPFACDLIGRNRRGVEGPVDVLPDPMAGEGRAEAAENVVAGQQPPPQVEINRGERVTRV